MCAVVNNLLLDNTADTHSHSQSGNTTTTIRNGNVSPYSITERKVPEVIPVLGSQPAGGVSHKPGGRLP